MLKSRFRHHDGKRDGCGLCGALKIRTTRAIACQYIMQKRLFQSSLYGVSFRVFYLLRTKILVFSKSGQSLLSIFYTPRRSVSVRVGWYGSAVYKHMLRTRSVRISCGQTCAHDPDHADHPWTKCTGHTDRTDR